MVQPCGDCITLQTATIAIAIVDIIGAVIGILSSSIVALGMLLFKDEIQKIIPDINKEEASTLANSTEIRSLVRQTPWITLIVGLIVTAGMIFGILTFLSVICLISLYLGGILLIGARGRRILKCYLWCRMKALLLVVSLLFMMVAAVTSPGRIWILIFGSFALLYQLYCLWVVKGFIFEIRMGKYHRRASSIYSNCEEDIHEFGEEMQKL